LLIFFFAKNSSIADQLFLKIIILLFLLTNVTQIKETYNTTDETYTICTFLAYDIQGESF